MILPRLWIDSKILSHSLVFEIFLLFLICIGNALEYLQKSTMACDIDIIYGKNPVLINIRTVRASVSPGYPNTRDLGAKHKCAKAWSLIDMSTSKSIKLRAQAIAEETQKKILSALSS